MVAIRTAGQDHDRNALPLPAGEQPALVPDREARKSSPMDVSLGQRMLSAVSGSILTSLLATPLDVVRVRLQAQHSPSPSARLPTFADLPPNLGVTTCCREVFWVQNQSQFCVAAPTPASVIDERIISDCAAEETQRKTFNSTFDGLRKIARNEGILTLWRGLSPTLMMAIPANVIYFAGYDWLRYSPRSPIAYRVSDAYAPLVGGSIARILAAACVNPIEILRTRMQATRSKEKGVMRATMVGLKDMVSNEGYHTLWRGLTLTMWRDVPFSALYWWGYELGRKKLRDVRRGQESGLTPLNRGEFSTAQILTDSFVAGGVSGAISALVTTPFDVGKTRQQTVRYQGQTNADLPEARTMPRFLWHIYCSEGMTGLFRGWGARCLKVAPACAIMISTYELGKKMASDANEKKGGLME